ncbi:hypothetical protein [Breoghania sp.]|uniref:hypothetical protein n=1 Tax=Breoghania sp. TaxID=2065378 RepID=UPI00262C4E3A|nr:hypothetical protein [Breoghania sp.]MDJ0933076.1 hypothetical protein [Breoghania sp.]
MQFRFWAYGRFYVGFSPGYGYDAIAIALLGALSPIGMIASAFFFAVLHAGSVPLQAIAEISREMVGVVSGLVVAFVAPQPAIGRGLSHIRSVRTARCLSGSSSDPKSAIRAESSREMTP